MGEGRGGGASVVVVQAVEAMVAVERVAVAV